MDETTAGRRVRLRDGGRFVGDIWPGSDERQRRDILISALWSGRVPMRARMIAKPRRKDGRPALPMLEQKRLLGGDTPIPGIEQILLAADPRTMTLDIPAGRIVISAFIGNDDKGLWAPFFPGWLTTAAGRFIAIEFDDIEFEGAAARAYIVENLLPNDATPSAAAPAPPRKRRALYLSALETWLAERDTITLRQIRPQTLAKEFFAHCAATDPAVNALLPGRPRYLEHAITRIIRAQALRDLTLNDPQAQATATPSASKRQ